MIMSQQQEQADEGIIITLLLLLSSNDEQNGRIYEGLQSFLAKCIFRTLCSQQPDLAKGIYRHIISRKTLQPNLYAFFQYSYLLLRICYIGRY
jgi:hypothetical protein